MQGSFIWWMQGTPTGRGIYHHTRGVKYHQGAWRLGPRPSGTQEVFNKAHSSLRSVIEQSFGVLKMKWRMLLAIPSYPERTQAEIILACCGLHNFILENDDEDVDFALSSAFGGMALVEEDENDAENRRDADEVEDDVNMNVVRDEIASACLLAQRRR